VLLSRCLSTFAVPLIFVAVAAAAVATVVKLVGPPMVVTVMMMMMMLLLMIMQAQNYRTGLPSWTEYLNIIITRSVNHLTYIDISLIS